METYPSISAYKNDRPAVVTIGTFDGMHIGHKAILKKLTDAGNRENLDSVVLTFFPHPRMVLQQNVEIKLLNTIAERTELLRKTGLQHLITHPFTKKFARLSAEEYVRDVLVNGLNAKKIIIGYDHRFGKNRTADIEDLRKFGEVYNFKVAEITAREIDDVAISSTKIRRALASGKVEIANSYLGYEYMISGKIVEGKALGRTIGYPTANLHLKEDYKLVPKDGVYITRANLDNKRVFGLTNIGTNPTVGGNKKTIETHFLDWDQNLYGKTITIEFLKYIREEKEFNSIEVMRQAIVQDEVFARQYIENQ